MKATRSLSLLTAVLLATLFLQGASGVWILLLKADCTLAGLIEYYAPSSSKVKSFIGILEIYWFHIFSVTLVAFVFAHFLPFIANISIPLRQKLHWMFLLSSALFVFSPFLAFYGGSFFALTGVAGLLMLQLAMLIELYFLLKLLTSSSEKST